LTYRELDGRVESWAGALRALGAGPESRIGVCLPRSMELVTVLLAIGRAGAAYVALDPEWPSSRLGSVAADADPWLVVSDRAIPGIPAVRIVSPGDLAGAPGAGEATPVSIFPSDLAYVLYTSGSTGEPKGVMIEHRSVANLLSWSQRLYPLGEGSRVLQKAPLAFDASVWEIFAPLVAGATLVLAPPGSEIDPAAMARCIRDEGITHLKLVPSLLRMLLSTPEFRECSALEHVFSGGEALPGDLVEVFHRQSTARLHNLYGPTETCVDVAAHSCRAGERGRVPIGTAIDNTELLVLDASGRPAPAGIPGELGVKGVALARGYLGRDALTRERFVPDPRDPASRIYRTGDRVRERSDGELEFLGRLDDQVKIRGVRVEPGEIEETLRAHPGVGRAIVLVRAAESGLALVAYVEADRGSRPAPRELRDFTSSRLPRAMVPDAFVVLDAFPLTGSGKIDRGALPAPDRTALGAAEAAVPVSAEERLLAGIWSDVLGVGTVGVDDNLFDLGGNSLLVFQITARAARAGYPVTPRQLVEHQTVAELARAAGPLPREASAAMEPAVARV
jgi:amino acid adenylation domain-containing protein